jgi:predicted MFS family arabinose efflux permease
VVALVVGILTLIFELSYQAYLPSLVGIQHVVEGNSKLAASAAVSEFGGFTLGGWLVHMFTAPFAILIDAISFIVSALSLQLIRAHEIIEPSQESPNMLREIREGLGVVYQHSLLRFSAVVFTITSLSGGILSALVVLYMGRELGFDPGILGMIWAVGGVSSFFGASLTPYITRRLSRGPAMVAGLTLYGVSTFFIPLASGATLLSVLFLIIQQLGDGFYVVFEINMVSFRQEIISERMLGRVNATLRFAALGATLVGSLLGGLLGESLGVRTTLLIAAGGTLFASAILAISPLGKLKNPRHKSRF